MFLDIYFLSRLVRTDGLIVLDDVWMPAVRDAIAYYVRNDALVLEEGIHPGAFAWSSLRRFKRRRSPVMLHDQLGVLRVLAPIVAA